MVIRTETPRRAAAWLLLTTCAACSAEQDRAERPTTDPPKAASSTQGQHTAPTSSAATATERTARAIQRKCVTDSDCSPEFCDHDVCAEVGIPIPYGMRIAYGRECMLPPPPSPPPPPDPTRNPKADAWNDMCFGYPCIQGRCRSCRSDADCAYAMNGGTICRPEEDWPGKLCGHEAHPAPRGSITPASPPPPLIEPVPSNLPNGAAPPPPIPWYRQIFPGAQTPAPPPEFWSPPGASSKP